MFVLGITGREDVSSESSSSPFLPSDQISCSISKNCWVQKHTVYRNCERLLFRSTSGGYHVSFIESWVNINYCQSSWMCVWIEIFTVCEHSKKKLDVAVYEWLVISYLFMLFPTHDNKFNIILGLMNHTFIYFTIMMISEPDRPDPALLSPSHPQFQI